MKRLRCWSLYLAATCLLIAVAVPDARAQLDRPPIIGIIDIQGVLRASTAVQTLSAEIESQRDGAQAAIQDREEALRAADVDLAQRRASLSPEGYAKEREALEKAGLRFRITANMHDDALRS